MIILKRILSNEQGTIGLLLNGSEFICFTLEDPIREDKIAGYTAIPFGQYQLVRRDSGRFFNAYRNRWNHKFVPELLNVPNFSAILIHTGNTVDDTEGCILVGEGCDMSSMEISRSRPAYVALYDLLAEMDEMPMLNVVELG